MRVEDLDYVLPPDRIAQTPVEPRDQARLMVVHRADGRIDHRSFRELGHYLRPGDVLVANDSRVIPARLHGRKPATGGALEVLLLRPVDNTTWEALVRGRTRAGTRIAFATPSGSAVGAEVVGTRASGVRIIRFDQPVSDLTGQIGEVPLPPYITTSLADPERYQTVYARVSGSAAAPTAGLHFTPRLLSELATQGIELAFVTLHVGLDTFKPIEVLDVRDHPIHREWCELPAATADIINRARRSGGRVVAIGTTAVRVLETAAGTAANGDTVVPFEGWTDLFIMPDYRFRAVDALVTNFHLPRSTLLLLVAAFMGQDLLAHTYRQAVDHHYRFYSFGDASLIL